MQAKLERDEYRSEEAFVCDLLLIFRNCRTSVAATMHLTAAG